MPPKPKTEAERQQFRSLLIDSARELFVARGIQAVTMREIAGRIGYSATSIYLHFKDKEDLLRAISNADFLALCARLEESSPIEDPIDRLTVMGQIYVQFAMLNPNSYRLMFMGAKRLDLDENATATQHEIDKDPYMLITNVVEEAFKANHFREDIQDFELIAQTFWAGLHGVCALQISVLEDKWINWRDISTRLELMQSALLQGLLRKFF